MMMRRFSMLIALAGLAIVFGALSQYEVSADEKKTEAREDKKEDELGKDPAKLAKGLDDLFDQLHDDNDIRAAKKCNDDEFMRRIYLDLVGRPPLPTEIDEFRPGRKDIYGNKGDEKRAALVDRLLESPEHARHFAMWWTTTMVGRRADGNSKKYLRIYLEEAFAENRPWSQVVQEVVAAKGKTPDNPAIGYLMSFQNRKADMAGITSKVFLGKQIQCAECHDHPYEHWTQDDFEGMEAFFRLTSTGARGRGADRYWFINDGNQRNKHEVSNRARMKGEYLFPTYLGRETWEWEEGKTVRDALAEWMTSPDNHWFRNMSVNRYMAYFLGLGFVTPVDDFNALNEPTFPVVLDIMGKDFAASGFDTHYLIRAIVNSSLYQREVDLNRTNRDDFKYYSRAYVKKLMPEQIHASILHVVGIERLNPTEPVRAVAENKLTPDEKANKKIRDGVNSWKSHIGRLMYQAYGSDPDTKELGDYDGTIVQALMLLNADMLGPSWLTNSLDDILERHESHNARVEEIFMTVLGRRPDKSDAAILNGVAGNWTGQSGYEDLFIALMNTTEFATNH